MTDLWPDEKKPYYPGPATAIGLSLLLMCPTSGWVLYVLDSHGELHGDMINGMTMMVCFVPTLLLAINAILRLFFALGRKKGWPAFLAIGAGIVACLALGGGLALAASMIHTQQS
ncbi:hypothetical protein R8Z50_35375 [Longispora sp. K20-0274]|uniref:hypothetical protein n=1 Tax=Longispora sp. K20-0274 TaxID=3088255 RepID=UPI00399C02FC